MVRIAVSGHRGLSPETSSLVAKGIEAVLAERGPETVRGITCLADGADQLLAQAVIALGGTLTVVIPASAYRAGLPKDCWPAYDALLAKASAVILLDHDESNEIAHMDASRRMLEEADELFAVWDGKPARGYGGTADVVGAARQQNLPVTIIWPTGASRG